MREERATAILAGGARGPARAEGHSSLGILLAIVARELDIETAAAFVPADGGPGLRIAAAYNLGEAAAAALTAAVQNPGHPVARTFSGRALAYNVAPTAAGGPAFRSHLPLVLGRGDGGR